MSSHDTLNPTGGVTVGHDVEPPNPDENLLERILSRENLLQAWKRVKANKGAAGVDDMSIEGFPAYLRDHWEEIRDSLFAGTYQPSPVRRVEIPKATGGTRPLGIPTVLDRLIQQAIAQELTPIFDPTFSDSSFGFRPGRSAHDALTPGSGIHPKRLPHCRRSGPLQVFRALWTTTSCSSDWHEKSKTSGFYASSANTCEPGLWWMGSFRKPASGSPKGVLFRRSCPIPCWMIWTKSSSAAVIISPGTPTTSSS